MNENDLNPKRLLELDDSVTPEIVVAPSVPKLDIDETINIVTVTEHITEVETVIVRGETIDEEGKARSLKDKALAESLGFAPQETVVPIGTLYAQIGVDNFREERLEYERLPWTDNGCKKFINTIRAEKREDHEIELRTLKFLEDGRISRGQGSIPITKEAFKRFCAMVTPGGAGYLAECPPKLRKINVDHWLANAFSIDGRETSRQNQAWERECRKAKRLGQKLPSKPEPVRIPMRAQLRTKLRNDIDAREVYAVVGKGYRPFDADLVAEKVAELAPPKSRVEIKYDPGRRYTIRVLTFTDVKPEKVVAGEFFKAGYEIAGSDFGDMSIEGHGVIYRGLCKNHIIIGRSTMKIGSRRHVGDEISRAVESIIFNANKVIEPFMNAWSAGSVEDVIDVYGCADPAELFTALVHARTVWVPGTRPEELIDRLVEAWRKEPGHTKTSIINAITRAAHENPWSSPWTTNDLEETAGEMLFQKVWNVQFDEKENAE